jgi:Domain of Unknown Function (DUF928)
MLKKTFLFAALCLSLSVELFNSTAPAIAIPRNSTFLTPRRSLLKFKVPGIRASRNREGGLARGACSPQDIMAVLPPKPQTMRENQLPVELTVSERPTFFVNIPQTSVQEAVFLLRDESGKKILLEKTLSINATSGIATYTLPADFPGLEAGKKYRWRLSLICDANDSSSNPRTGGWIERVQPTVLVQKRLQTASNRNKVAIYADNGYWLDTIKALADLRTANPTDKTLVNDWVAIFQSVGLNRIANKPLVELKTTP